MASAPAPSPNTEGRPLLGDLVGIGRTAEVFAWGGDAVVKLLRPGFPDRLGDEEAEIATRLDAAEVAAPRYLGSTRIDGRYGLIYERLVGPSMLDLLTGRPWAVDRLAARFAELHVRMHGRAGAGLPEHRVTLRRSIDWAADGLGDARRGAALARLETLTAGSAICHGDMHPGNVIMAGSGPVVIDWLTASAGPPEADVARSLFLLTGSVVPGEYPRVQRALIELLRRRFAGTYLRRYRQLRRVDERQLALWRLPVLAARLAEWVDAERAPLLDAIDADLARS